MADILNEEITLDEIISSIKTLKNGKSAGPDSLNAEFYKSTCSEIAPILKDLFNSILDTGVSPKSFGETVLSPIHKSGPISDPHNFRGIALVNSMHKIFSSILNKRLYFWVEDNKKLDESQAGFRAGYSAIDNIFSLSSVVQKYLSRRGGWGVGGDFTVCMLIFKKPLIRLNMYISLKVMKKRNTWQILTDS